MIRLNNVKKHFGDKEALKGISLTINKGRPLPSLAAPARANPLFYGS